MIIFDLDDTLIDTSGSVTPFKLKECLRRFLVSGLALADFDRAYEDLLSINATSSGSKEALVQFLEKYGGNPKWMEEALKEMTSPLPLEFVISTTPNAKEILKIFAKSHLLALVTGGHPPFQLEKLKKAGIEPSIFSKIAIPEDSIKKPFYEGLVREFSLSPRDVLVCGDRVKMDLFPAFELGFTTVHMRWGRGRRQETATWVHHAVSDLNELKRIVQI